MEAQDKPDARLETDYSREIVNASRHLTSLVDDILDLSSIESRRQQLQLQPIEIGALLSGCAELVQPEVQHKQLQLQVMEAADPPLFVQGDPRRAVSYTHLSLQRLSCAGAWGNNAGYRLGVRWGR